MAFTQNWVFTYLPGIYLGKYDIYLSKYLTSGFLRFPSVKLRKVSDVTDKE